MSKNRKHGVYAVGEIQSRIIKGNKSWSPISYGMEVVFKQMQIAGNRPRTIQSYDYIFSQFYKFNEIDVTFEKNKKKHPSNGMLFIIDD